MPVVLEVPRNPLQRVLIIRFLMIAEEMQIQGLAFFVFQMENFVKSVSIRKFLV